MSAKRNSFSLSKHLSRGVIASLGYAHKGKPSDQTAGMSEICIYGEPHASIKVQPRRHLEESK